MNHSIMKYTIEGESSASEVQDCPFHKRMIRRDINTVDRQAACRAQRRDSPK